MLAERISEFVRDPRRGDFAELALAVFREQVERLPFYGDLCARRGLRADRIEDWRAIPPLPVAAFKRLELGPADAPLTFRSSGTGGGATSVHRQAYPELYRLAIDESFPRFCLPAGGPIAMLSLVPSRAQVPDSSLAFMVEHLLARFGAPGSDLAFGPRGVELAKARSWLGARQREGRPVLLLTTAFALADLLEGLVRLDLRFRLAAGSAAMVTGGYKGRRRELGAEELQALLAARLGLGADAIVGEYGMTELTSQCYTRALSGGDPDLFVPPPWMRVRVLEPLDLSECPSGRTGLLSFVDLANLGSAVHLLSEDLGVVEGDGFRLRGRAAGAELRGCSLLVEELTAGG